MCIFSSSVDKRIYTCLNFRGVCGEVCVLNDIKTGTRSWIHEVGMQALRLQKTLENTPTTLPGKVYARLKGGIVIPRATQLAPLSPGTQQSFIQCTKHQKKRVNKSEN